MKWQHNLSNTFEGEDSPSLSCQFEISIVNIFRDNWEQVKSVQTNPSLPYNAHMGHLGLRVYGAGYIQQFHELT